MSHRKEILTAAGTLACAIGIGFVMQSGDAANSRYGSDATAIAVSPANAPVLLQGEAMLEVEGITLTSAGVQGVSELPVFDDPVKTVAAPSSRLPAPDVPERAPSPDCQVSATADVAEAAMVDLVLSAPCLPNERVTVHHSGMMFTETTSANGKMTAKVPALDKDAVFVMAFSNGDGAVAQASVDTLALFNRVVLQWKGDSGFQIHAREFGAGYGDKGHVWSGADGKADSIINGETGFLTQHGDMSAPDPLLAEVYSFPIAANTSFGTVELSVEAEVTPGNCGQEIEAQSLELRSDSIRTQDLILSVPDCDAIGNFLVLNNLLQDLKVAGN
ncbi:hypothetical protein [Sulfitobacter sabulilitoris]|uniref:Translocase n=1 Tax=Sulfitobacter sabulilitoris TaxID=2562655 RepID=A0A5S3PF25_9RHOB|nr:hypothetical protein [Sulfitobacter sabulilitoris]TMM52645.1 hypothetical protein FDT80_10260 [Sulfitobacter sabulilitoris]